MQLFHSWTIMKILSIWQFPNDHANNDHFKTEVTISPVSAQTRNKRIVCVALQSCLRYLNWASAANYHMDVCLVFGPHHRYLNTYSIHTHSCTLIRTYSIHTRAQSFTLTAHTHTCTHLHSYSTYTHSCTHIRPYSIHTHPHVHSRTHLQRAHTRGHTNTHTAHTHTPTRAQS